MGPNMLNITDANFESTVLQSKEPVLVDFWAAWCGPCVALAPTIESLSDDFAGQAKIAKLDVDANPQTASAYGIRSIPTVLIYKDGKVVDQVVGRRDKETYAALLKRHM